MSNLAARAGFLLQALTRRTRACPHCGTHGERVGRKHVVVGIRRCPACRLHFTDPVYRPRFRALYERLYGAEGLTTQMPPPERLAELKESCFAGTDKDASERLARMRRAGAQGRLLEIGSSWGYFLYQARAAGFDVTGIEISERRRAFGVRELGVPIVGSFESLSGQSFDCVYTSHVLEHFTDLSTVFSDIAELLRPGGKLFIEVPRANPPAESGDSGEPGSPGGVPWSALGAVHPLGFTSEFFAQALPAYGFEDITFFDGWPSYPDQATPVSRGAEVLCVARRRERSEAAA